MLNRFLSPYIKPLLYTSQRRLSTTSTQQPTVLVYGGAGALGQSIINTYNKLTQYNTISVDYTHNNNASNNYILNSDLHWKTQANELLNKLGDSNVKLQSVVCVAGGWSGNNIANDTLFDNTDLQIQQHIYSSLTAAHIASQLCTHYALNVLTGSSVVYHNKPGCESMISYSICKSAVHQLTKSLSLPHNGLPANTTTICIAPITLDTPNNRKFMSDANFTNWTKCELIAECVVRFSLLQQYKHHSKHQIGQCVELDEYNFNDEIKDIELVNGGIYEFITQNDKTTINIL